MSSLIPALVWLLLPKTRVLTWCLCALAILSWPLAVGSLVMGLAWNRLAGERSLRSQRQDLQQASIYWVEVLYIQTAAGTPLPLALNCAHEAWAQAYPSLVSHCVDSRLDSIDQCRALAQSSAMLWRQVGQGLQRLHGQGADPSQWLGQLIDEHYRSEDEKRQSQAAALGSKLLMPLILGALPQGFLIIGFVVWAGGGP